MGNAKIKHHPLTGALLLPLGYRKDGRAIWPIMGGDDTVPPATPPADAPPADAPPVTPPADTPPVDSGKGGKDAVLADLAKERDARQALEKQVTDLQTAQQTQLDAIAKALGLKQDEPPDPAKLAEQVTTEQAKAREAAVQLAVYRNAAQAGGDPDALLDSATFLSGLAKVDPTDAQAVATAIKAAVEASPRLGSAPAGPTPPPSFGGGARRTGDKPEPEPGLARMRQAYADTTKK